MRILVLSDIHANLTALESVLDIAGQVDATWCLGDVVGYGPDPNECVRTLQSLPNLVCLLGNHDAAALGQIDLTAFNREARASAQWTQSVLDSNSKRFLSSLPEKQVVSGVTLVHGSPRNPVWEYMLDSMTAELNFRCMDTHLCFVGHTHLPVAFYYHANNHPRVAWQLLRENESPDLSVRAFLNPGSVGQPRDHDSRASFAIFDLEAQTWHNYRVAYNVSTVQARIIRSGLPSHHANRLSEGW